MVSLLTAVLLAVVPSVAGAASDSDSLEYAVKAAYLYKMGSFVEWPASVFPTSYGPVNICVVGEDPFGSVLDKAVEGQHIADRPIAIVRLKSINRDASCHIVYFGGTDTRQVTQAIEAVKGVGILTITDEARSGAEGGIVHFVVKDNRVRFDIDDRAAAANGLTISSKLLSLALSVKPRS